MIKQYRESEKECGKEKGDIHCKVMRNRKKEYYDNKGRVGEDYSINMEFEETKFNELRVVVEY